MTFTPTDTTTYATVTAQVEINVDPAALTVTAYNATRTYGAANPTFTNTITGFVNGDGPSVVSGAANLSTTATTTSIVGSYPISAALGTLSAANYTFAFTNGTLMVTQATPGITWSNPADIAYGQPLGATQLDATANVPGGFVYVLADGATPASGALLNAGQNQVLDVTFTPTDTTDYTTVAAQVHVNVDPAPLAVTGSGTQVYGSSPSFAATYSGFVLGQSSNVLGGTVAFATTTTSGSAVGTYPNAVTPSDLTSTNYAISFATGSMVVTPAPLTISADNQSMVYGGTFPTLTASYNGFVNGDAAASLTTPPAVITTATAASHAEGSPYPITASGAVDADYTISYVAGMFTLTPAALTITAEDKTKVYGAALPELSASYSGFVNGDTAASLTAQPILSTAATAASHVIGNPYAITAAGAADADYTISYVPGTLIVDPVALTITADSKHKNYGAALPTLTTSYVGFVNGDTPASLTAPPILSTTAMAASHVNGNPYTITAAGAADADYTIGYVAGALTVDPVALTVTADSKQKNYGAALPTLTARYAGLVNGDVPASLTTPPTLTTTATAASHVGGNPHSITGAGAADADYTINYLTGSLIVDPVALTIAADTKHKNYGAALPTLTAGFSGFVNGDTAANLTAQPVLSTTATPASHVSGNPYAINAAGAADADYTISYVAGALTVDPVALTITADDKLKVTGAALPTLTARYAGLVNGDVPASLTTPPTLATTATAASAAGSYPITVGGAADSDYAIVYVSGTLTVTPPSGTPNERYVTSVYGDVLARAPDAAGLAYWVQLLNGGAAVSSVAAAIAHSDEYYANFVIMPAYLDLLGRAADEAGVKFWTSQMDAGVTDQELEADLVSAGGTTGEFYKNAGGTNTDWIDAVYKLLLGRAADAAGEMYWNGQLDAGQTLNQVAQGIAGSQENDTQLINDDYFHYLGRAADGDGLNYWLGQFADGKTNEDVIAGFTGSAEYYKEKTSG